MKGIVFCRLIIGLISFLGMNIVSAQNEGHLETYSVLELKKRAEAAHKEGRLGQFEKYAGSCFKRLDESLSANDTAFLDIRRKLIAYHRGGVEDQKAWYNVSRLVSICEQVYGVDHPRYHESLVLKASVFVGLKKFKESTVLLEKVFNIYEQQNVQNSVYMFALNIKAYEEYKQMNSFENAITLCKKIKAIYKEKGQPRHYNNGIVLLYLGRIAKIKEQYVEALEYLGQAQEILKDKPRFRTVYLTIMLDKANIHSKRREYKIAFELYEKAKELHKYIYGEKHKVYAVFLLRTAKVYSKKKKYTQAFAFLKEAININTVLNGPSDNFTLIAMKSLADLYSTTGDYQKALNEYTLILSLLSNDKSPKGLHRLIRAYVEESLGIIKKNQGNYSEGEVYLDKARSFYLERFGPTYKMYLRVLIPSAECAIETGHLDKAKRLLEEVIQATTGLVLPPELDNEWFSMLENLELNSIVYFERLSSAVLSWNKLLQKTHKNKPELEELKKRFGALEAKIINHFDNRMINNKNAKSMLLGIKEKFFHNYLGNKSKYTPTDLFVMADGVKSTLLWDAVKANIANEERFLPSETIAERNKLKNRITELKSTFYKLDKGPVKSAVYQKINHQKKKYQALEDSLSILYPEYYELISTSSISSLAQIQKQLSPKMTLLEYVVRDSITHIFKITKDSISLYSIPVIKSVLEEKVKDYQRILRRYKFNAYSNKSHYEQYKYQSYWFFDKLIKQVLKGDTKTERLVIIPDEIIGHLSFETFLTAAPSIVKVGTNEALPCLLHKYSISYDYSALTWEFRQRKESNLKNGKILALANYYNPYTGVNKTSKKKNKYFRLSVHSEIEALEKSFRGDFLHGNNISESNFKEMAPNYAVLHLATHSIVNIVDADYSKLLIGEDIDIDSLGNGFWDAYEIAEELLENDLVVLSACKTAYGKYEKGKGVASIARSFLLANTAAVVASLWEVNSDESQKIIKYFYENLSEGMPKDIALQKAKLSFIKKEGINNPGSWATFVLLGNSNPIELEKQAVFRVFIDYYKGSILTLLIVGLAGYFIWRYRVKQ